MIVYIVNIEVFMYTVDTEDIAKLLALSWSALNRVANNIKAMIHKK